MLLQSTRTLLQPYGPPHALGCFESLHTTRNDKDALHVGVHTTHVLLHGVTYLCRS